MMARQPNEVRHPEAARDHQIVVGLMVAGAVAGVGAVLWLCAQATGTGHGSPVEWVRAWVDDRPAWSARATFVLVVGVLVAGLLSAALVRRFGLWDRWLRRRRLRSVDRLARLMSAQEDEQDLRERACLEFARRVRLPEMYSPGLPLGRGVAFKRPLFVNYELTVLVLMGPRMGKTTALCVPQIVDFAGPVLACSNKRDLCDLTRGPRSGRGKVWVHDMQGIAQESASWWWDPLAFIRAGEDKASRAARLAGAWQACSADRNASTDAYFGPGGQTLLANLLLVAALERLELASVLTYLGDLEVHRANLRDPVEVLREHGFDEMATLLASDRQLTPKQLDGLVGTARGILSFLREPAFREWITPQEDRREFDPGEFVTSSDTLILLSQNTVGSSSRAIVTALTMAVADAGVQVARRSPGGRLVRPMLLMLDEAANICPWPELPDQYSYLGSHGILPVTILQNRAQGVKAWGKDGMDQLVSSASVMLVGGGINDSAHLRDLVELIGQRQKATTTANRGHGWKSRSTGHQVQWEQLIPASRLAAWPRERVIAFAPGSRPILVSTQHWKDGPHAELIAASNDYYTPAGEERDALAGRGEAA